MWILARVQRELLPCVPVSPSSPPRAGLVLRDMRTPGAAMRPACLKLPEQLLEQLDSCAAAYSTSRAVLARTLIAEGLERCAAAGQGQEVQ